MVITNAMMMYHWIIQNLEAIGTPTAMRSAETLTKDLIPQVQQAINNPKTGHSNVVHLTKMLSSLKGK